MYPTGGLSVINFNITNWNKIDEKTGILDAFITPQYLEEYEKIINIYLASPRGFCAGVKRAIEIVELALQKYGPPIYVRHEIVHNKRVVQELSKKGAVFVEELEEIPLGSRVIFSAHGVSKKIKKVAKDYKHLTLDATCPLVSKVHKQTEKYFNKDYKIILIGHKGIQK